MDSSTVRPVAEWEREDFEVLYPCRPKDAPMCNPSGDDQRCSRAVGHEGLHANYAGRWERPVIQSVRVRTD